MVCCNTQSSQKAKPCLFFSVAPCLGESEHFTREAGRQGAVCLILKSSSSGCQGPPWLGVSPLQPPRDEWPWSAAGAPKEALLPQPVLGCSLWDGVQLCFVLLCHHKKQFCVSFFKQQQKNPSVSPGCEELCLVLWTSAKFGDWATQINWILGLVTVRPVEPNPCKWCVTLSSSLNHCTQIYFF